MKVSVLNVYVYLGIFQEITSDLHDLRKVIKRKLCGLPHNFALLPIKI